MSGATVLLVDGDYLLRGLNPRAALDKAFSIADALEQDLIRPISSATSTASQNTGGGDEHVVLRFCFFTEQLLHRTAAACSAAGTGTGSTEETVCTQYIAGIKASRFQVVLVPESNAPDRRGTSAVDAALATKAAILSVRNTKIAKFLFFCNAGSYATVLQHLANEGKDVFVCSFVDDAMPDLVDWAAYLGSTPGAPNGVVRVQRMTGAMKTEAPPAVPHAGRSLAQISAANGEKRPVVAPPPLPNGANPFEDFFGENTNNNNNSKPSSPSSTGGPAAGTAPTANTAAAPSSSAADPPTAAGTSTSSQQQRVASVPPSGEALQAAASANSSETNRLLSHQPLEEPPARVESSVTQQQQQPHPSQIVAASANQPPPPVAQAQPQFQHQQTQPPQQQQQDAPSTTSRPASSDPQPQPNVVTPLPAACSIHFDAHYRRHYYMVPDGSGGAKSQWEHPLGPSEQVNVERQVNDWYEAQKAKKNNNVNNVSISNGGSGAAGGTPAPAVHQGGDGGAGNVAVPQARQAPQAPVAQETRSSVAVRPPTLPGGGAASQGVDQPLPIGWEAVYDGPSMRMVYVHRASGTRTFDRPPTQPAAAGAQQQPASAVGGGVAEERSAWIMRVDPASGRTYFVNPITKQSVWTLPPGASATLSTTSSGSGGNASAGGNASGNVQQTGSNNNNGYPSQQQQQQQQQQYPPGGSGGAAYSQPQQQQAQQPYPQQQMQQPQPNPTPNPSAPRLPTGWEARVDPQTGKTFYVDHVLKRTTWSLPPNAS